MFQLICGTFSIYLPSGSATWHLLPHGTLSFTHSLWFHCHQCLLHWKRWIPLLSCHIQCKHILPIGHNVPHQCTLPNRQCKKCSGQCSSMLQLHNHLDVRANHKITPECIGNTSSMDSGFAQSLTMSWFSNVATVTMTKLEFDHPLVHHLKLLLNQFN